MRQNVASTERQGHAERHPDGSAYAWRGKRGKTTMAKALSGSAPRIVALGLVAMFAANANAQDTTRQRQGQSIVANKCSSCHAVGRLDQSRNPKAPAFRTLHERYPIESLAEALAEGTISAASEEPEFNFSGREVGAIIAYISMIQEPSPHGETMDLREKVGHRRVVGLVH
jgi:cytochrome c